MEGKRRPGRKARRTMEGKRRARRSQKKGQEEAEGRPEKPPGSYRGRSQKEGQQHWGSLRPLRAL